MHLLKFITRHKSWFVIVTDRMSHVPGDIDGAHGPVLADRDGMPVLEVVPLVDRLLLGVEQLDGHSGGEALDLALPVEERRQRRDDQEGAGPLVHLDQVAEEGDGLQGLAQSHLVRKLKKE